MSVDRHKSSPVTFRPPADDRAWLVEHAKSTGQPVGSILTRALRMYRAKHDDERGECPGGGGACIC